jgi:hypothetical protein
MPRRKRIGPVPLCGAKRRQGEGTCRKPAGAGTDHPGVGRCRLHGGCTPSHRRAGQDRRIEEGARTMLERENLVPVDNPLQQLQMLAAEVVAWKDILGTKVEELGAWSHDDVNEHEDVRAIILPFERALDRCNTVLSGLVRLGVEERLVRLSEAQAELIKGVIMAVLDSREMGLSRELRQTGRAILARELVEVTSASRSPVIGVAEHASS